MNCILYACEVVGTDVWNPLRSLCILQAHRTLIVRELKKLQSLISVSVVDYLMLEGGWRFAAPEEGKPATTPDHVYGSKYIRELYFKADADYSG